MNDRNLARRLVVAAALVAVAGPGGTPAASAQHVTPAMAMTITMTKGRDAAGCEERARQASGKLDALQARLERARLTNSDSEVRAAVEAMQKGLAEVNTALAPCRPGAANPVAETQAAPPAPATAAAAAPAGMDHAQMNTGAAGATAPTTVRQISGPAEAALQSFRDALEIGNRDLALQWLMPEATVTEAGGTDPSRDVYARAHMDLDVTFLKTAKVVLLDRQLHPAGETTHIMSTSRVTGRAGEIPVDVKVTEGALLKRTPQGWRIASLAWTVEPWASTDLR